jgi:hypothetical protein
MTAMGASDYFEKQDVDLKVDLLLQLQPVLSYMTDQFSVHDGGCGTRQPREFDKRSNVCPVRASGGKGSVTVDGMDETLRSSKRGYE